MGPSQTGACRDKRKAATSGNVIILAGRSGDEVNIAQQDRIAQREHACPRCGAEPGKSCWEKARGNPGRDVCSPAARRESRAGAGGARLSFRLLTRGELPRTVGVEVELELPAVTSVPAAMSLSWELNACWLVSFRAVDRHQPEQRRNRARSGAAGCWPGRRPGRRWPSRREPALRRVVACSAVCL